MLRLGGIMMGGISAVTYRYLLFDVTANNGSAYLHVGELQWFAGATDYPTQAMTDYTVPSPLVVTYSADNASDRAWQLYNNVLSSVGWQLGAGVTIGWVQLDLGSGNGIAPTSCTVTSTIAGDSTRSPKNFTFEGSNTGSFSGEEVVLATVTDATSWGGNEARNYTF
jgi:hypothetical protein